MTEKWRAIPSAPDYEVSNLGAVRRLTPGPGAVVGAILRPWKKNTGHLIVGLQVDGRPRRLGVHRLVLEAFVGPCPEGMEGCHNDGDPTNNRVGNLRWDTSSANSRDMVRHGRNNVSKSACPRGHAYAGTNLLVIPSRPEARYCRACNRERSRAWSEGRPFSAANSDAIYASLVGSA
ncbi:NUMOD4 motif-containing HNH endonuclease [Agromyces larvae]|uniref:NUMOD4 motif-containing HNH endonuclease n=1 Tax=Agromyces larvae TaxID=2929802 RepID=UPI00338FFC31